MAPMDLSASQLLSLSEPERIFTTPDAKIIHKEFLHLAAKWHPDVCKDPKADDVLAHLTVLRKRADEKVEMGFWQAPGLLTLKMKTGKPLLVKYKKHHTFELGDFYVCNTSVVYLLKAGNSEFVDFFMRAMSQYKFASDRMKEEISRYLPIIGNKTLRALETIDGREVLVIKKNADQILLRDLVDHFGTLDPRHSTWIVSCLLNLACYLEYNNQTLNDFSLDTIYVSPEHHSVSLLGGWWYSVPRGSRLTAVPRRTLNILPPKVLSTKLASRRTDLELIRLVARELFGDKTGFGSIPGVSDIILNWMRFPSSGSAKKDYSYWTDVVLKKAFGGKRTFTKLEVTSEQIYKEP